MYRVLVDWGRGCGLELNGDYRELATAELAAESARLNDAVSVEIEEVEDE